MEDDFVEQVIGRLDRFKGLGCCAMFGGHGLFRGPILFGIMLAGRVYLKTNAVTVHEYTRRGMRPFRAEGRMLEAYYEVPPEVVHDRRRLPQWCEAAARCAEARCALGAVRDSVRPSVKAAVQLGEGRSVPVVQFPSA